MFKMARRVYPNVPAYQRSYYNGLVISRFNPGVINRLDKSETRAARFKQVADPLLPAEDNSNQKWINHHDLAIAIASVFPELRPEVDGWVSFHNWKEYWESENLVVRDKDKPAVLIKKNIVLDEGNIEDKFHFKNPEKSSERFRRFIEIVDGGSNSRARSIIEIGSGVSPILFDWARRGNDYRGVGVDYKREVSWVGNLAYVQKKGKIQGKVKFETRDVFAGRFPKSSALNQKYDVCYNFGLIVHFSSQRQGQILELMIRLTKPGGIILVGAPNYWSPSIMQRRWLLHRAARRHECADYFNLWWPFGYEQPITRLELRKLFEDQTPLVRDIQDSGVTPFHDFKWREIWKYTKLEGSRSWFMPNEYFEKRLGGMTRAISHMITGKSDEDKLEGQYGWIQPLYAPLIYLMGLPPRLISTVLDLFGGVASKYFGNQVIVWAKKA